MTGFAAFALPVVALLAFIAGQAVLGVALLGASAVCFLLLSRAGATRR